MVRHPNIVSAVEFSSIRSNAQVDLVHIATRDVEAMYSLFKDACERSLPKSLIVLQLHRIHLCLLSHVEPQNDILSQTFHAIEIMDVSVILQVPVRCSSP
jgi:hypothetical protein